MKDIEGFHPAVQVAVVVMGGSVGIVFFLAMCTDFFDNISRRK